LLDRPPSSWRFAAAAAATVFTVPDRAGRRAAVAGVLAHFARRPLDLAARYGGEGFAVVLFDTTRDHAVRIGEEIMVAVRALSIVHSDSSAARVLTISIGIACVVPASKRSWQGLVQLADQALYAAKDAGRNQARVQEAEYEHMKTGYFSRHAAEKNEPKKP
jgi:diguanylate cyclase (GGDEF)-like protein